LQNKVDQLQFDEIGRPRLTRLHCLGTAYGLSDRTNE